uniref:Pentatricopeptide repeat-containing protein, mitochondrial n=1 Tax=Noccaea caerulescens TaxID=107243 RepID=A0A1J3E4P6_NOCCA
MLAYSSLSSPAQALREESNPNHFQSPPCPNPQARHHSILPFSQYPRQCLRQMRRRFSCSPAIRRNATQRSHGPLFSQLLINRLSPVRLSLYFLPAVGFIRMISCSRRLSSLACANLESINHGKQVHCRFTVSEYSNDDVFKSSLVDMYAKCGFLDSAKLVFDSIRLKNTISWTAMVSGYCWCNTKVEVKRVFTGAGCNRVVNNVSWGASCLVSFGAQNAAVAIFSPKLVPVSLIFLRFYFVFGKQES